jgi:hypothetical protein
MLHEFRVLPRLVSSEHITLSDGEVLMRESMYFDKGLNPVQGKTVWARDLRIVACALRCGCYVGINFTNPENIPL